MNERFPVKLFEVRDRATFIPVMAVKLMHGGAGDPHAGAERFLLRRAGYDASQIDPLAQEPFGLSPYVLLIRLAIGGAHYDPYSWDGGRTMRIAHMHIIEHWNELASGQVLDVEFILGEKPAPKLSEQVSL